mmetsp:Transcript_18759/g.34748  ORF Transcript_18759/g.34748 Transcript_18759/m.34748 type:complete len:1114 (+) Transcript_18759:65-3406(+)
MAGRRTLVRFNEDEKHSRLKEDLLSEYRPIEVPKGSGKKKRAQHAPAVQRASSTDVIHSAHMMAPRQRLVLADDDPSNNYDAMIAQSAAKELAVMPLLEPNCGEIGEFPLNRTDDISEDNYDPQHGSHDQRCNTLESPAATPVVVPKHSKDLDFSSEEDVPSAAKVAFASVRSKSGPRWKRKQPLQRVRAPKVRRTSKLIASKTPSQTSTMSTRKDARSSSRSGYTNSKVKLRGRQNYLSSAKAETSRLKFDALEIEEIEDVSDLSSEGEVIGREPQHLTSRNHTPLSLLRTDSQGPNQGQQQLAEPNSDHTQTTTTWIHDMFEESNGNEGGRSRVKLESVASMMNKSGGITSGHPKTQKSKRPQGGALGKLCDLLDRARNRFHRSLVEKEMWESTHAMPTSPKRVEEPVLMPTKSPWEAPSLRLHILEATLQGHLIRASVTVEEAFNVAPSCEHLAIPVGIKLTAYFPRSGGGLNDTMTGPKGQPNAMFKQSSKITLDPYTQSAQVLGQLGHLGRVVVSNELSGLDVRLFWPWTFVQDEKVLLSASLVLVEGRDATKLSLSRESNVRQAVEEPSSEAQSNEGDKNGSVAMNHSKEKQSEELDYYEDAMTLLAESLEGDGWEQLSPGPNGLVDRRITRLQGIVECASLREVLCVGRGGGRLSVDFAPPGSQWSSVLARRSRDSLKFCELLIPPQQTELFYSILGDDAKSSFVLSQARLVGFRPMSWTRRDVPTLQGHQSVPWAQYLVGKYGDMDFGELAILAFNEATCLEIQPPEVADVRLVHGLQGCEGSRTSALCRILHMVDDVLFVASLGPVEPKPRSVHIVENCLSRAIRALCRKGDWVLCRDVAVDQHGFLVLDQASTLEKVEFFESLPSSVTRQGSISVSFWGGETVECSWGRQNESAAKYPLFTANPNGTVVFNNPDVELGVPLLVRAVEQPDGFNRELLTHVEALGEVLKKKKINSSETWFMVRLKGVIQEVGFAEKSRLGRIDKPNEQWVYHEHALTVGEAMSVSRSEKDSREVALQIGLESCTNTLRVRMRNSDLLSLAGHATPNLNLVTALAQNGHVHVFCLVHLTQLKALRDLGNREPILLTSLALLEDQSMASLVAKDPM